MKFRIIMSVLVIGILLAIAVISEDGDSQPKTQETDSNFIVR